MNLELGSGCKSFGKKYMPECFATDLDKTLIVRCPDHEIDQFCDAHNTELPGNSYNCVIICNPWNYGFKDIYHGIPILREITRVLINTGQLVIIGNYTNKWCTPENVTRLINSSEAQEIASFDLISCESISASDEFPEFIFKSASGNQIFPAFKLSIKIVKD